MTPGTAPRPLGTYRPSSSWPARFRPCRAHSIDSCHAIRVVSTCFGVVDEWHLNFASSFEHLEFDLLPRPLQALVPPGPPPGHARLEAVGPVGDAVHGDGPE